MSTPAPPENPLGDLGKLGAFAPLIAEAKKQGAAFEAEVKRAFQQVLDNQVKMWAKLQAIERKIDGAVDQGEVTNGP